MATLPQQRLRESADAVCMRLGDADAARAVAAFHDDTLLALLGSISDAQRALQVLGALATAEVTRRSERGLGYAGLAQRKGHRTGTDLVQSVTGQTRAEVRRATAVGEDLRAAPPSDGESAPPTAVTADVAATRGPWFEPLTGALRSGVVSREQYEAIRRGLGEPPVESYPDLEPDFLPAAWTTAAVALILEAQDRGVEELASAARLARDSLDPAGVRLRFEERFERRSFRSWIDRDGQHHARIDFDDEAAVWVHTILNAALRPRRGPRFVDADAAPVATAPDDPRTTEQLQYDTLMAVLRTGAAADPTRAFGDRQPGVRIVVSERSLSERDAGGRPSGAAFADETGQALPNAISATQARGRCSSRATARRSTSDGTDACSRSGSGWPWRSATADASIAAPSRPAARPTTFDIGQTRMGAPTWPTAFCSAGTATCACTTWAAGSRGSGRRTTCTFPDRSPGCCGRARCSDSNGPARPGDVRPGPLTGGQNRPGRRPQRAERRRWRLSAPLRRPDRRRPRRRATRRRGVRGRRP